MVMSISSTFGVWASWTQTPTGSVKNPNVMQFCDANDPCHGECGAQAVDPAEVLESAAYHGLAAEVAKKAGNALQMSAGCGCLNGVL